MSSETEMIAREPDPLYYKGWAIWSSPMGLITCERTDTAMPETTSFEKIEDVFRYIDKQTKRK